jgi:hypothetical protein
VDSKFADVSARKKNWIHHITVCGEGQTTMLAVENSAVFQGSENRVVEVLEKEITDEILAGNAAASVIQQNSVI